MGIRMDIYIYTDEIHVPNCLQVMLANKGGRIYNIWKSDGVKDPGGGSTMRATGRFWHFSQPVFKYWTISALADAFLGFFLFKIRSSMAHNAAVHIQDATAISFHHKALQFRDQAQRDMYSDLILTPYNKQATLMMCRMARA